MSKTHPFPVLPLCLTLLFLSQCHTSKPAALQESVEQIARTSLGNTFQIVYNSSSTYALCYQERKNDHINRKLKFVIVRLQDKKKTYQDTFQNGYVKWKDDLTVEVVSAGAGRENKKLINVANDR